MHLRFPHSLTGWRPVLGQAVLISGLTVAGLGPVAANQRTFIAIPNSCSVIGGQAVIKKESETHYIEVLGSTTGRSLRMCAAGDPFGFRTCKDVTLYNFSVVCNGDIASAPQFFLGLFGSDRATTRKGFALSGDQLTYIDPGEGNVPARRIALPRGFAPMHDGPMDSFFKRVQWDDAAKRIAMTGNLSADQERRLRELFRMREGGVEPFPASHLERAAAIAREPAPRPAPPKAPAPESRVPDMGGGHINSALVVIIGLLLLLVGLLARPGIPKSVRVFVMLAVPIGVSVTLYLLGVKTDLTLLSIPIFAGLAIALIYTVVG